MTKTIADTHVDLIVPDIVLCILDILTHSSRQAHEGWKIEAESSDLSRVKKLAGGRCCNLSLSWFKGNILDHCPTIFILLSKYHLIIMFSLTDRL